MLRYVESFIEPKPIVSRRTTNGGFVVLALLAALGAGPVRGQPVPQGAPFSSTHFTAQEYRAQPQNWSIAQDERGLMYFANNDGVLQYDGERWRLIETEANTAVRSVATDSQGTVYAGAGGDFGVLRPDSTSTLEYVSLSDRLSREERDFKEVWYTHAVGEDVYFQTRKRLFRWNGDSLRSWKSEGIFHTSFVVRDQLYVRESGRGLLRVDGDALQLVPGGERFAEKAVFAMLPHGSDDILVGRSGGTFFLYDGQTFEPFSTEASPLLKETPLYHGAELPGGEMALATLGGGVLIIDRAGRLVQVLTSKTALPDGTINHVYLDEQGGLWMALDNQGIVRAEVSSPLSRFGKGFGLEGIVYDLHRHDDALHAATGSGLYALTKQSAAGRSRHRFEKVPGVPATWSFVSVGGALYAATREGVYRLQHGRTTLLLKKQAFSLAAPPASGEGQAVPLYVGTAEGLGRLRKTESGGRFQLIARTNAEVRAMTLTAAGALWFSTSDGTVFRLSKARLKPRSPRDTLVRPQRFDSSNGLPSGKGAVSSFQGAPVYASQQGLYHVRRTASDTTFYADTTLTGPGRGASSRLRAFYETDSGAAWLFYDDHVNVARPESSGRYVRTAPPALQFPRDNIVRALVEPDGSAWISNADELLHYDDGRATRLRDARLRDAEEARPGVRIRHVRDATSGAVLHTGGTSSAGASFVASYEHNRLRVSFALPEYGGAPPTLYRYRLKGKGEWSDWRPRAQASLESLYEGAYTLEVQARNAEEGAAVTQASLTLRVLPPWYRTIWAYLSYVVGVVLMAAGYRHYRNLRAERRRAHERARRHKRETQREREARERLEEANERLEEANRLKTNFLANTSHEFRTPLASIMGYAEALEDELEENDLPREQQRAFLQTIQQSGERLLNTVDLLLEVAQLRAGTLEFDPVPVEVNQAVEEAAEPFRAEAQEKGLAFHFAFSETPVRLRLPLSYFHRIVENLVDNAVKFTHEGAVHVAVRDDGGHVRVVVRDTGIGIPGDHPGRLFDEFKQTSEGITREHEGIGLGLTIAGRLARLMGGAITVESTEGEGSCFTLRLPKE